MSVCIARSWEAGNPGGFVLCFFLNFSLLQNFLLRFLGLPHSNHKECYLFLSPASSARPDRLCGCVRLSGLFKTGWMPRDFFRNKEKVDWSFYSIRPFCFLSKILPGRRKGRKTMDYELV